MKNPIKLIIIPLISLQILNAESCESKTCKTRYSSKPITIKFPFFLKDGQPESCGLPGFELYCDDELGTLLEFPNAGNFTVDSISYEYMREIQLSDPNKCIVQKMLLLSLTNTPFKPNTPSTIFSLYNCSGTDDHYGSDVRFGGFYNNNYFKISCLSGSNYTIVAGKNPSSTSSDSRCKFLKILSAPISDFYMLYYYSLSIRLTWDDPKCMSCGSSSKAWLGGLLAVVLFIFIISASCMWCDWRRSKRNAATSIVTSSDTNHANSPRQTPVQLGLDHITTNVAPIITSTVANHANSTRDTHNEPGLNHITTNVPPIITSTVTNHANSTRDTHNEPGLDHITTNVPPIITSTVTNLPNSPWQTDGPELVHIMNNPYLTVVIGESRRLIKPDYDKCSICLSDYSPGDILNILPECLHRFHADCIAIWLSSKHTCPICRISLL